ncbi:hypothetical protein [Mucilaginibacter flavus]|uniref:hypothetical protein n=1 Tax=Mucilaginibacter flavus TaxID=931504 RepID=UPI0025B3DE83|nr:hypothetical protein [Mucilaginibacter flavus]MDN3582373.1 hypothetical protein [Mucilaginibacter flavus]
MKTFIKYISLLLFSGLIIPFYAFTFKAGTISHLKANSSTSGPNPTTPNHTLAYNIASDIAKTIFPVLKSLKSL